MALRTFLSAVLPVTLMSATAPFVYAADNVGPQKADSISITQNSDSSLKHQPLELDEAETPIDMDADSMEMDRKAGVIKAEGDVQITRAYFMKLRADRAEYLMPSKQIKASGNIRLVRQGDLFTSERVVMDLAEKNGSLQQVNINLRGPGGLATAKTAIFRHEGGGPERDFLHLKEATFTNCECELGPDQPSPPWHFKAKTVDVDRAKNSVTAKNVRLYAGDVPVLMLPWWQQPLEPRRKSGLLRPLFLVGGSGFEMEMPYYLNLAENRDSTIALRTISERGLMGKLQYRYLGSNYSGTWDTHGLYDSMEEKYRGLMVVDHEHILGSWKVQSHLEGSLSRDYINDFDQKLVDNRSRRMESVAMATRYWQRSRGYSRFQSGVRWYQDLEQESDELTVQSLPFALFTDSRLLHRASRSKDRPLFARGDWRLDSEARVDNYYQSSGDSVQRLDVAPTVHFETPLYFGRASAAVGLRETAYLLHGEPNQVDIDRSNNLHREAAMISLRFDGKLRKQYKNKYLHTIEPSLQYVMNSSTNQNLLPNYDSSLRSFTMTDIFARNLYSGIDRISDGQWFAYGLTSRFLSHEASNAMWERGVFTIGQRWAPENDREYQDGHAFSSVASRLDLTFSDELSVTTALGYNPYLKAVESSDVVLSMAFARDAEKLDESDYFLRSGQMKLAHYYNNPDALSSSGIITQTDDVIENSREKVNDLLLDASLRIAEHWVVQQRSDYSLELSQLKSWRTGLTYEHQCWDVTVTGGRDLATTTNQHGGGFVGFLINLQGLGGVGI